MSFEMSHDSLSKLACKWLLRTYSQRGPGCKCALTEVGAASKGEVADAWGYNLTYKYSVLVEVKVSRSDFLADKNKPHRNGEVLGMGNYRYYMCPEGLIDESDIPHGWGLLWVNARGHIKPICGNVITDHPYRNDGDNELYWHEANKQKELEVTAHLLSRLDNPQKYNEMLRNSNAQVSRLSKQLDNQYRRQQRNQMRNLKATLLVDKLLMMESKSDELIAILDEYKA